MTAGDWTLLGALLGSIWVVALSPLLVPLVFAIRLGPARLPGRWLFVFVGACMGYGFSNLIAIVLWFPVSALGAYVVPQLQVDFVEAAHALGPLIERLYGAQLWLWAPALLAFWSSPGLVDGLGLGTQAVSGSVSGVG